MSQSRLASKASSKTTIQRLLLISRSSSSTNKNIPEPALRQLSMPSNEKGFFKYERDWSRDSRYKGQKLGDTPARMLFRKLGHTYEYYPLVVLYVVWIVTLCLTIYISFDKMEVWLNRHGPNPPWEWERIRNNYWKKRTLALDRGGVSHQRCKLMEQLQDEMLKASKKRHNGE
ncbi:hypothetical protein Tcan_07251 [Toxocara canis]|uniref:Uncharacterized protein n=1 Tax=Toxocara canis TaxID=6265 RepID=A0A0B2UTH2_TOXCA|nr:hypothetical protein Tcan_07251 [Toxocara canis]